MRTFTNDGAGNITSDVRSGSTYTYGTNARGRLATVHQDGNLKGSYSYNSLEQLASRVVTNSGPFDGTVHTTQDRNVIAEADGTTGVVAKEYIWLPGAGYAGTDLPVGVVDVAGTATPELLYVNADHLGRPIRLTDPAKVTAWAVEWLPWGGVWRQRQHRRRFAPGKALSFRRSPLSQSSCSQCARHQERREIGRNHIE